MQLAEFYNECRNQAILIPGFVEGKKEDVPYDIDIIANGYCDALDRNDEAGKNAYLCAGIIRYWHMIFYYINKSPNVPTDTIIDWIVMGFLKACKYRSWMKDPKLINNKRGAEICINNAIDTNRKTFYKRSNALKRADGFFEANTVYLDALERQEAEPILSVEEESYPLDLEIVNKLLESERYLDGVVVDLLLNGDSVTNTYRAKIFSKEIKSLNNGYYEYFLSKYNVKNVNLLKSQTSNLSKWKIQQAFLRLQKTPFIKDLQD